MLHKKSKDDDGIRPSTHQKFGRRNVVYANTINSSSSSGRGAKKGRSNGYHGESIDRMNHETFGEINEGDEIEEWHMEYALCEEYQKFKLEQGFANGREYPLAAAAADDKVRSSSYPPAPPIVSGIWSSTAGRSPLLLRPLTESDRLYCIQAHAYPQNWRGKKGKVITIPRKEGTWMSPHEMKGVLHQQLTQMARTQKALSRPQLIDPGEDVNYVKDPLLERGTCYCGLIGIEEDDEVDDDDDDDGDVGLLRCRFTCPQGKYICGRQNTAILHVLDHGLLLLDDISSRDRRGVSPEQHSQVKQLFETLTGTAYDDHSGLSIEQLASAADNLATCLIKERGRQLCVDAWLIYLTKQQQALSFFTLAAVLAHGPLSYILCWRGSKAAGHFSQPLKRLIRNRFADDVLEEFTRSLQQACGALLLQSSHYKQEPHFLRLTAIFLISLSMTMSNGSPADISYLQSCAVRTYRDAVLANEAFTRDPLKRWLAPIQNTNAQGYLNSPVLMIAHVILLSASVPLKSNTVNIDMQRIVRKALESQQTLASREVEMLLFYTSVANAVHSMKNVENTAIELGDAAVLFTAIKKGASDALLTRVLRLAISTTICDDGGITPEQYIVQLCERFPP